MHSVLTNLLLPTLSHYHTKSQAGSGTVGEKRPTVNKKGAVSEERDGDSGGDAARLYFQEPTSSVSKCSCNSSLVSPINSTSSYFEIVAQITDVLK